MSQITENSRAPVVVSAEIHVSAPVEVVWGVLSDFDSWPDWNKAVSKMEMDGDLGVGAAFVWVTNGTKIRSRLEELNSPHRMVWSGRTFGIRAMHVWEFQTTNGGTQVRTTESFEGLMARLFRRSMKKMLVKSLEQGVMSLKAEAEACHDLLGG